MTEPDLDALAALIRRRRTSLLLDPVRTVPPAIVEQLCELAQWAPNHKRTWPWRFAVVEGEGRARLGHVIAEAMAERGDPAEKVAKARTKYLRAPSLLVVGSAEGDSELRTAENRDAVAVGVQHILLGATAAGLASYWGSCPKGANDVVAELCGFAPGTFVAAIVYLGWPTGEVAVPQRPPVQLRVIDE
ncbi:MAG: nitroreductase [Ilumatobacteraceae bacterium]